MIGFDLPTLKKIVIFLENKLRQRDPNMGDIYQENIKNFFLKIKNMFSEANEKLNENDIIKN